MTVSFSRQTEGGTDVTHSEGGTIGMESLSVRETDSEGQSRDKDDDLLSRDETESRDPVSRDTALLEGVGARPKTTTKTLQRKNTPVVLPKVASLYGSLPVQYLQSRSCGRKSRNCSMSLKDFINVIQGYFSTPRNPGHDPFGEYLSTRRVAIIREDCHDSRPPRNA